MVADWLFSAGGPVGSIGGMSIIDAYLVCARSAAALLADEAVASSWDAPSALEHYTVAGLAGHLGGQIWVVEKVLPLVV